MLPELWHDLRYRIKALVRRADFERDLQAELDAHLTRETEAHERQGVPAAEARRRARVAFGGLESVKEASRSARGTACFESVVQDIRLALRRLRAQPAFAVVVCLALALGIGMNVAAFSVIKGVLLNPLPYPNTSQLVMIWAREGGDTSRRLSPTVPEYVAWRDRTHLFDGVATYGLLKADLAADDRGAAAEEVLTQECTANLFAILGVPPELGRTFTDAENRIDTSGDVVMISHRLWQRRFRGDPNVIGRRIQLDQSPKTIIGVMPADFVFVAETADVWIPVSLNRSRLQGSARGWPVVARLKSGVTVNEAQAEADAVSARLGAERGTASSLGALVRPLHQALFGTYVRPLAILEGFAALVLLIACANVSGLLLARTIARRRDFVIREAIGAGRARLVRQLVIESLLLAAFGGCAAIGVAWLALDLLLTSGPVSLPRAASIGLDPQAVLCAVAVSVGAAILFGLLPSIYISRTNLGESVRSSNDAGSNSTGALRLRGGLVTLQIALAMVLLVGAGLLVNTFVRLRSNGLGGDPERVMTFSLQFAPRRFHRLIGSFAGLPLLEVSPIPARLTEDLWQRLERVPGVVSAAAVNHVPFAERPPFVPLTIEGRPEADIAHRDGDLRVRTQIVSPHFFSTMKIPLVSGRDFGREDTSAAPWVALVNAAMAQTFWHGKNPIGDRIRIDLVPDDQPRKVVGVVADSRSSPSEREAVPVFYTLASQQPAHNLAPYAGERLKMTFVARTTGDPLAIVPGMRRAVDDVDPGRPPVDIHLLERDIWGQFAGETYLTSVMSLFAVLAALLSALGIYGVVAHSVAQRSREFAIRTVLGAGRRAMWRLALVDVGWFLACGLALGLAAATLSTRLIQSALWGVAPTDVPTYAAATVLMTVTALVALYVPVRRMLASAPLTALKAD